MNSSPSAVTVGSARVPLGPIVACLMGKNIREFARSPQQAALVIVQQVMFLLIFRYVLGGAIDPPAGVHYADFLAPGILIAGAVFAATRAAVTTVEDRVLGFRDRVRSLPVPPGVEVVARWIADGLVTVAAVGVTLLAAVVVGFRPAGSVREYGVAVLLLVVFCFAATLVFVALGQLASDVEAAQGLGFVAVPITFVSSAYVPTDGMPSWLATVAEHQPITVIIDALRILVTDIPSATGSPMMALLWCVILLLAAGAAATNMRS